MTLDTDSAPRGRSVPRTVPPRQLAWLRGEVGAWTREGLLADDQAAAVLARYRAGRRIPVARLLLLLGAGFVGVGVIWLVAANLDQLGPLTRFVLVTLLWLAALGGAEALDARRGRDSRIGQTVVLALRFLAALGLGAVVFQAAQSLHVPAWEPALVGWWAVGALLHAYAVRSEGPLLVGLATGLTWFLWAVLDVAPSGSGVVLALLAAGGLGVGLGAVHTRRLRTFSDPWRELGAALALAALFAAALPYVTPEDLRWDPWLVVGLLAAALALAAGASLARGRDRLEPLGLLVVAALTVLLVLWDTGADTERLTTGDWLHAVVSVAVYVVVAVSVAVLGTLRDSWRLTAVAAVALVAFTTFQSFAVFARIIDGAWLFVVLGLVLLGTGVLFDRTRRGVAAALEGTEQRS